MRRRQKGGTQYTKLAESGEFQNVAEGGLRFLVNFTDYLDTGLFFDHRPTRARIRELAAGKRFLNLFAYTGTATVYAAAGGARRDDERRHVADVRGLGAPQPRAERLPLSGRHGLRARRRARMARAPVEQRYDLVFLDPPTLSRSKRMAAELDRAARPRAS